MRHYELMWILGAASSEGDGVASVERVRSLVTSRGGEVQKAEFWARRTMSYAIKGNREGAYFVARFSVDGKQAPEIERAMHNDQTVIRHMLVRAEEIEETIATGPAAGTAESESRGPAAAVPAGSVAPEPAAVEVVSVSAEPEKAST